MPARSKKSSRKKKPAAKKKPARKKKAGAKKKATAKKKSSGKKAAAKKKPAGKKAAKKKKAAAKKPTRKKAATGKKAPRKKPARRQAARKGKDEALARHDPDFLLGLYRDMIRTRALDERIEALYKQGQLVAGCFSCRGQEGCSVGSTAAVRPDDIIGPMIRNLGSMIRHGLPPERVLENYLGRATGPSKGRDGNSHFGAIEHNIFGPISMLASLIPVCAGAALSFQMRGEDRVALTWIGDGGSNVGDFHEGLNFAGVLKLPLVVVLENNKWAYSTPIEFQTAAKDFACRAEGYGIMADKVDGNDVLAMYEVTKKAVDRARAGEGPTLIEADTMRMRGHAIHDDAKYVPPEMFAEWEKKDPILLFERRLRAAKLLDDEKDAEIRDAIKAEIDAGTEEAMSKPVPTGDPAIELGDVYA